MQEHPKTVATENDEVSGAILAATSRIAALAQSRAKDIDIAEAYSPEMWNAIKQSGLGGLCIPNEFGGADVSIQLFCQVVEMLAAADCTTATLVHLQGNNVFLLKSAPNRVAAESLMRDMVDKQVLTSYSMTEPGAGSDAGAITATAVPEGDYYRINGTKCFSSWASMADTVLLLARISTLPPKHGISAFIVRPPQKGFTISRKEKKLGLRGAPLCEVTIQDLMVHKRDCLGEAGLFKEAMKSLDYSRIGIAAMSVGLADGAFRYAMKYVNERKVFGQAVGDFQGVQFKLADMATGVEAARLLTMEAARRADAGQPFTKLASMAKYFASDVAMKVTTDAVQLLGGHGYTAEHPVERMMRDAKGIQIFEGANELQRALVYRYLRREME